jgi:uncharacterized protein YndB with AHSA1/START domain
MCWMPGLPTKLESKYPRDGAPLEASRSCEGEEALGVRKERLVAAFENTVVIRRPIEEVFAFLSHFENVPSWNYAIIETRKISEGPVGVGTIYQQVRSVPTRSEERFEVTAYDPARHLEIQGQLGPFPARLSYALDALPEGTRVTNSVELELHGPGPRPTALRYGTVPSLDDASIQADRPRTRFTPAARSCF